MSEPSRRLFLRGVGGTLLALPILPSLLTPREALAQTAAANKCFVHFRTPHGGVSSANMWPSDAALKETLPYTHEIRRGQLVATTNGAGDAAISPVLTAKASALSPAVVAKMNILRGLDIPMYMAHNFGGALGYYDSDKKTPGDAARDHRPNHGVLAGVLPERQFGPAAQRGRRARATAARSDTRLRGCDRPGVSTSAIGGTESSQGLFDTLLEGTSSMASSSGPARPPVADRILDSYKRLRNGNKRLSTEDKVRLDQHMNAVAELQRRMATTVTAGCQVPTRPTADNLGLRPMDRVSGEERAVLHDDQRGHRGGDELRRDAHRHVLDRRE